MYHQWIRSCLCAILVILAAHTSTWGGVLDVTVDTLGGGSFQYNLTLNNPFGEPLSGLNLLRGNSALGLNATSIVGAPTGWDFFLPLPPFVDELNYFSLSSATDVSVGGSLSGFFFQTTINPA